MFDVSGGLYLWPVFFFGVFLLSALVVSVLLWLNLLLGLLVVSLYGLFPKDVLFDSLVELGRNRRVEENLQSTFQLRLEYHPPPSAIFVWSPHGLFSVSSALFNCTSILKHDMYSPNHVVTMSILHYIPIIHDLLKYVRCIPSDYQNIKHVLERGSSVSIMLGGVREMMKTEEKSIQLYIKKRQGIFRMSLETNRPIIPILTYGENELLRPYDNSYIRWLNECLHKYLGINIPIVSWSSIAKWYELTYRPLTPIESFVGNPIHPKKEDTVESLRNSYIEEIKRIHEKSGKASEYTLIIH